MLVVGASPSKKLSCMGLAIKLVRNEGKLLEIVKKERTFKSNALCKELEMKKR